MIDETVRVLSRPNVPRRAVAAVLVAWTFIWTVYETVTSWPGGLNFDMIEAFAWSRHFDWSYAKHPPVEAWTAGLWFAIFPRADWAFHLLAVTNVSVTIWIFWLIAERYLPKDRQVVAIAVQSLVFLVIFHGFLYNANSAQMPWWALATLFFLRSFETRETPFAAAAGAAAALAVLSKYYAVFLIVSFVLAALSHPDRWKYFKSAAPWISSSVGLMCLAPHIYWLVTTHGHTPIDYAAGGHNLPRGQDVIEGIICLVRCFLFALFALIVFFVAVRPTKADVVEVVLPSDAERRQRLLLFAGPFFLSVIVLVALGKSPTDVWNIPAWSLFGVVLLSPPQMAVSQVARLRAVRAMLFFPMAALLISPVAAFVNDRYGRHNAARFEEQLAPMIEREWHEVSNSSLAYVEGSEQDGIAFYASDGPKPVGENKPEDLDSRGVAIICLVEDHACVQRLDAALAERPDGRRKIVQVRSRFLGADRASPNFLVAIIPPRITAQP